MERTNCTIKGKGPAGNAKLLRVYRIARMLDISKKRVYSLVTEGKLEAVRLGPRQTRITKESLDRYLQRLLLESRRQRGLLED